MCLCLIKHRNYTNPSFCLPLVSTRKGYSLFFYSILEHMETPMLLETFKFRWSLNFPKLRFNCNYSKRTSFKRVLSVQKRVKHHTHYWYWNQQHRGLFHYCNRESQLYKTSISKLQRKTAGLTANLTSLHLPFTQPACCKVQRMIYPLSQHLH